MSNSTQLKSELDASAISNERSPKEGFFTAGRLKRSLPAARELWGDFLTLVSLGVSIWFVLKSAFQLWR